MAPLLPAPRSRPHPPFPTFCPYLCKYSLYLTLLSDFLCASSFPTGALSHKKRDSSYMNQEANLTSGHQAPQSASPPPCPPPSPPRFTMSDDLITVSLFQEGHPLFPFWTSSLVPGCGGCCTRQSSSPGCSGGADRVIPWGKMESFQAAHPRVRRD